VHQSVRNSGRLAIIERRGGGADDQFLEIQLRCVIKRDNVDEAGVDTIFSAVASLAVAVPGGPGSLDTHGL